MSSFSFDLVRIGNRAKGLEPGVVRPEEVEYARKLLRERSGDIYAALYVVGLCGGKDDAPLIEQYLYGSENNVYVEVSLKALCRYLGLIDNYRGLVRELIFNPPDETGFRRMAAIHLADKYFENFQDDELGCELVRILCDLEDPHRSSTRDALVAILGLSHELNDPHGLSFDERDDDATLILKRACERFHCPTVQFVDPRNRH